MAPLGLQPAIATAVAGSPVSHNPKVPAGAVIQGGLQVPVSINAATSSGCCQIAGHSPVCKGVPGVRQLAKEHLKLCSPKRHASP